MHRYFVVIFGILSLACFVVINYRIKAIQIGYEIGEAKSREAELLKERSQLQATLSTLQTKKELFALAHYKEPRQP